MKGIKRNRYWLNKLLRDSLTEKRKRRFKDGEESLKLDSMH
jgi:hypothetical protein